MHTSLLYGHAIKTSLLYEQNSTRLGPVESLTGGHIGIYVEEEGPIWNILPQNDPNWNTGIRQRDQIGIWGTNMEYLGVEGPKWNITLLLLSPCVWAIL